MDRAQMKESLLALLEKDSRINVHDLSLVLGVEEIEVANAIGELERDNVICGYHTMINWENTSVEKVTALIEVKVTPQRGMGFDKIAERIYHYDEVDSLYLMSGAFDFTLIIEGESMKNVALFVANKLAVMDEVTSCATHFVLKRYKDHGTVFAAKKEDERMMITP